MKDGADRDIEKIEKRNGSKILILPASTVQEILLKAEVEVGKKQKNSLIASILRFLNPL